MELRIYDPRILAIDLRHRRFGYAIYEGHRRLLDWGVRTYPAVGESEVTMMRSRLTGLLRQYSPSAIVVKKERWARALTDLHMRGLVDAVTVEASRHQLSIRLLDSESIRKTFSNFGCETRDETASALARIFPELIWSLPPKRRPWQPEHSSMTTFDAIALGLAYWQHPNMEVSDR